MTERFDASVGTIGIVFFAVGVLQTCSFLLAPRVAKRFGLVPTMVFTHLPSNALLLALAFAPSLGVAIALLLARTCLAQMDVPTRQAYVMAVVEPSEREHRALCGASDRADPRGCGVHGDARAAARHRRRAEGHLRRVALAIVRVPRAGPASTADGR